MKSATTRPKNKGGRPPINGVPGRAYQIRLPPYVAEFLRTVGDGSLSQGIVRSAVGARKPAAK